MYLFVPKDLANRRTVMVLPYNVSSHTYVLEIFLTILEEGTNINLGEIACGKNSPPQNFFLFLFKTKIKNKEG